MRIIIDSNNTNILRCFSSKTRIKILEILNENPRNIGELAQMLNISSAITTRHVSMLEEAGVVTSKNIPGKRGLQKICSLAANEILFVFSEKELQENYHSVSIPIGQYVNHQVMPTCGLASSEGYIGICDDPRYFSDPHHINATLIWFQSGWIEYRFPGYITTCRPITAIEISLELCSEFPGYKENWPSDIHFYLNNVLLGIWTSPGDFGKKKGVYTPQWWKGNTQHGLLKTIRISPKNTMLDGILLSHTSLPKIPIKPNEDLIFRIASPLNARHPGGVNIFGKGFGNYDQDIEVRVEYEV